MKRNALVAAVVACGSLVGVAQAETIFGLTSNSANLVSFDSATPSTQSALIPITGVTTGLLRGIDFRPATGGLYGISYDTATEASQLYLINTTTGVASAVGAPIVLAGTGLVTRVSIDFNPVVDRLRVVTSAGTNYRINPNTGALAATDTNLAYAPGDVNSGATPLVADVAYTNNFAGATSTTLYAYEFNRDQILTIGSVNGSPSSPNTGLLFTVGGLGGPSAFDGGVGFDISSQTGIAYLSFDDAPSPTGFEELYTVNLATGAATLIGNEIGVNLLDISVAIPEPTALGLLPVAGLLLARRRR